MQLDHIAIYTRDLERLKDFYVRYFSGIPGEKYCNENTGLETYFIYFEAGARLELMSRTDLTEMPRLNPAEGFTHLSFKAGSRERVDEITKLLIEDGYLLKSEPRITGDGYYESCIFDPDCNEVEIVA